MGTLFDEQRIIKGAEFSECGKYRYALWRILEYDKPLVMFIGLNPSTANATTYDPTIKRVQSIARYNGYGGIYMLNCFPLISTDPDPFDDFYNTDLHSHEDEINFKWLDNTSKKCSDIIFAWGNFSVALSISKELINKFPNAKALHINKNGSPKHPLYCKTDITFKPFKNDNRTSIQTMV